MAQLDPVKNFANVEVSTGYNDSDTSIVLATGEGANLPDPAVEGEFNLPWFNSTNYPNVYDDPNREIVRVTAITGDTLTVTRGQEGISASTKNTASATYRMILVMTKKNRDDLEDSFTKKLNKELTNQSAVDLDAIITPDFYCCQADCTNLPELGKVKLEVRIDPLDSNNILQASISALSGLMYSRVSVDGGTNWGSWRTVGAGSTLHADLTDLQGGTTGEHYHLTSTELAKLSDIEALADVTDKENVGSSMTGATAKTTPVDADTMPLNDSADTNLLKKVTWANIKATLKTYFDTLYGSAVVDSNAFTTAGDWNALTGLSGDNVTQTSFNVDGLVEGIGVINTDGSKRWYTENITTLSNPSSSLTITAEEFVGASSEKTSPYLSSNSYSVHLKTDGTKAYVTDNTSKLFSQYALSTAWDISTLNNTPEKIFDWSSSSSTAYYLVLSSDGTKAYVNDLTSNAIREWTLSTAWDISTAVLTAVMSFSSVIIGSEQGFTFNSDGTKLYIIKENDSIFQWTLSTAWDISTAIYANKKYEFYTEEKWGYIRGIVMNSDDTEIILRGYYDSMLRWVTLTTPGDISTAEYRGKDNYNAGLDNVTAIDIYLKPDDSKIYIHDINNDQIEQFSLTEFSGELLAQIVKE